MYTLLNFIINLFTSYSSLFHFYTLELSEDIYFFEFINSIILFIILFFIFFRFLIKRYTFKILCVFIVKRIFFTTFLFFLFYFFSGFMYCETPINKGIKSFINNDTKKYLCIATMTITSCYIGYKYLPVFYTTIKNYNNYKISLIQKKEYDLKYQVYLEYIEKQKKLKNIQIEHLNNFSIQSEKFTSILLNYILNYNNAQDNITILKDNIGIKIANEILILKYSPFKMSDELNFKLVKILKNYEKSFIIIKDLKESKKIYTIDLQSIEINHSDFLVNVATLIDFYNLRVFNEIRKIEQLEYYNINNDIIGENNLIEMPLYLKDLKILIDNTLYSSNQLLSGIESISTFPLVTDCLQFNLNLKEVEKPLEIIDIDYSFNNLENINLIGINLGYLCFYPILYCSNKIFGTINPLSSKVFKEAILFFFPFSGFF